MRLGEHEGQLEDENPQGYGATLIPSLAQHITHAPYV